MSDAHRHGEGRCMDIFARLSEYLDGELPEDLCERIDGHMDGCQPCQVFLESLKRTVKLVEADEAREMPEEVRQALRQAWEMCRE